MFAYYDADIRTITVPAYLHIWMGSPLSGPRSVPFGTREEYTVSKVIIDQEYFG